MPSLRSPRREWYTGTSCLLPEMPMLGWTRPLAAGDLDLAPHRHAGAWELCWLRRGEVDWWVEGESHTVPQGHCYLTHPDELHGGDHGILQACDLYWLHLRLPLPGLDLPDLEARLVALPRVFRADQVSAGMWWDLIGEHRQAGGLGATAAARAALHRLLVATLRSAAAHGASPLSPAIARATALARTGLDQPLRVAALARAAGLSPSRFHDRFIAEVGEPPASWLRRQRLSRAKQLLAAGRSVTAVAHELGFPSSQWFATVFRRHSGVAPSAWRANRTPT
ncbi:AraC family transcriptional regulator [Planctomycetota bacterium]|nr:AraC family transcriptional regulator [Planctomycetota bacterium]